MKLSHSAQHSICANRLFRSSVLGGHREIRRLFHTFALFLQPIFSSVVIYHVSTVVDKQIICNRLHSLTIRLVGKSCTFHQPLGTSSFKDSSLQHFQSTSPKCHHLIHLQTGILSPAELKLDHFVKRAQYFFFGIYIRDSFHNILPIRCGNNHGVLPFTRVEFIEFFIRKFRLHHIHRPSTFKRLGLLDGGSLNINVVDLLCGNLQWS
mmetsp:Transcript_6957/g.15922  ORF Transcript_6957/g.15922 Transcript_6957/m.15922 type:complete len:208 (+) Transcript_6957:234-857(+)